MFCGTAHRTGFPRRKSLRENACLFIEIGAMDRVVFRSFFRCVRREADIEPLRFIQLTPERPKFTESCRKPLQIFFSALGFTPAVQKARSFLRRPRKAFLFFAQRSDLFRQHNQPLCAAFFLCLALLFKALCFGQRFFSKLQLIVFRQKRFQCSRLFCGFIRFREPCLLTLSPDANILQCGLCFF